MRDAVERTLAHDEAIEHIWVTRGSGANALVVTGSRVMIAKKGENFFVWDVNTLPRAAISAAVFRRGLGRGRWQTPAYVSLGSSASPTLTRRDRRVTDLNGDQAALRDPYTARFDNDVLDDIARVIASV